MDENWRYPYDFGNLHMMVFTVMNGKMNGD